MKKCVFFDRDGIVNTSPGPGYVERWEDFHIQSGFIEAAKVAASHGYVCAIITNQRGVARGIMSRDALDGIHANLERQLAAAGVHLLGIWVCVHERDTCTCRKPLPGMLHAAAREHALDLSASWMVGDQPTDIEAGRRAGCRTILVNPDTGLAEATLHVAAIAELPAVLQDVLD